MSGLYFGGGGIFAEDERYMAEFSSDEMADGLVNAVDYMAEHGWTQGQLLNDAGQVCAMGAMRRSLKIDYDQAQDAITQATSAAARQDYERRRRLYNALKGALRKCLRANHLPTAIGDWNDAIEQTQDNVQSFMRQCAETTRNNGGSDG